MNWIARWIRHWRDRQSARWDEHMAQQKAGIRGPCPICGGNVIDHLFFRLASARPHDPDTKYDSLIKEVDAGNWAVAAEVQEFRMAEDSIELELMQCPRDDEVALLTIESPYELMYDDRLSVAPSPAREPRPTERAAVDHTPVESS